MPNNKSGNYSIKVECGEVEICNVKPTSYDNNDQDYMIKVSKEFKFDYIGIIKDENTGNNIEQIEKYAWILQLPDIILS